MTVARMFPNICSRKLNESKNFYIELLNFEVKFESDWFIHLHIPENPAFELGIILRDHNLIPVEFQKMPEGTYLTFVVPNVEEIYSKAKEKNFTIVQAPKDEFYGQRRFLTIDPNGILLDISSPISEEPR